MNEKPPLQNLRFKWWEYVTSSYKSFQNGSLEIFIDKAVNPELETEIFVNANLTHYPLRDYASMWNTMSNVVRDYEKIGKRNKKKDDLHLNKHAMHLIRLFMMALDILEKGEINTCRVNEHDLLMDIRFGKYQKAAVEDLLAKKVKMCRNVVFMRAESIFEVRFAPSLHLFFRLKGFNMTRL